MGSGWENLKIQLALKGLNLFVNPRNVASFLFFFESPKPEDKLCYHVLFLGPSYS